MLRLKSFLAVVFLALPIDVSAATVQVAYGDIRADSTQNFQSFGSSIGLSNGFDFGDFTFSGSNPRVLVNTLFFCGASPDACLVNEGNILATNTFSVVEGTTFLGFDLFSNPNDDAYLVRVQGLSGQETQFTISGNGSYGFGNAAGIASVSITNQGGGTDFDVFTFDDIVLQIDDLAAIPVPASLPLLIGSLGALVMLRRRKRMA